MSRLIDRIIDLASGISMLISVTAVSDYELILTICAL